MKRALIWRGEVSQRKIGQLDQRARNTNRYTINREFIQLLRKAKRQRGEERKKRRDEVKRTRGAGLFAIIVPGGSFHRARWQALMAVVINRLI